MSASLPHSSSDPPATAVERAGPGTFSVRTRITILLGLVAIVFASAITVVQHRQNRQVELLMQERAAQVARVFDGIIELKASGARIHADDYTRWDDFVAFTKQPNPAWAQINLTQSIATFGLDVAWVLDLRFRLLFTANPSEDFALAPLPAPQGTLQTALLGNPIRHFFTRTPRGLLEVWTSPIHHSDDFARKSPVNGYYVIGRLWSRERIAELADLARGDVSLRPAEGAAAGVRASSRTGGIEVLVPLPALDGTPVSVLSYQTTYDMAPRVHDALRISMLFLVTGALIAFVLVGWALTHWVVRPLSVISASLRREDASLLRRTTRLHDEFGHLARLVREFFEQQRSLIEAREKAEAATRAKSQFLASVSHELRTPMHGVLSYARFGTQESPTATRAELQEYFTQIDECGRSLLALLDDLLDLAKFEAGRMRLESSTISLGEVAEDAADEFRSLYSERRLALEVHVQENLGTVIGDGTRLRQVFRNLLSNAAKFTPAGGSVAVHVTSEGDRARVCIDDSGHGIPEGELTLIFEKFTQASTTGSSAGGTGLGLALCHEIVQGHGGRIWAENRAPRGARFAFEIPVKGPEARARSPVAGAEEPEQRRPAA